MARPEIHDDLPDYVREGHHVATVSEEWLTRYPEMAGHLLAALVEAKAAGLQITRNPGTQITTVSKPKSDSELDTALRQAQESWDHRQETYLAAVEDPTSSRFDKDHTRRWIDHFATQEGLDPITWPADAEAVSA